MRLASQKEQIIIIDNGQPIATLTALEQPRIPTRLTDREEAIRNLPVIKVDSAAYIFEIRG